MAATEADSNKGGVNIPEERRYYDNTHWAEEADNAKGYALSGKIMLSAIVILFAVIVLMAGLHLYARWYLLRARRRQLRRRRRSNLVFYVDPTNPSSAAASRGLEAAVLKSIPVFSYTPGEAEEPTECAVCLSEFEENEKGRRLPKCNHCFHLDCIDMWFHSHSTCPLCRAPVDAGIPVHAAENELDSATQLPQIVITINEPGSSSGLVSEMNQHRDETASLGARRKAAELVGVSIEVPPRRNMSFGRSDDVFRSSPSPAFKSPGSRMRSLRRILSRDIRAALSPSSAPSCSSASHEVAVDLEMHKHLVDERDSASELRPRQENHES